jgi:cell division protease FtsH
MTVLGKNDVPLLGARILSQGNPQILKREMMKRSLVDTVSHSLTFQGHSTDQSPVPELTPSSDTKAAKKPALKGSNPTGSKGFWKRRRWIFPAGALALLGSYVGTNQVINALKPQTTYIKPEGFEVTEENGKQIATRHLENQEPVRLVDGIPDNTTDKIILSDVESILIKAKLGKIKAATLSTDGYPMYGFELRNESRTVMLLPKPTDDKENKRLIDGLAENGIRTMAPTPESAALRFLVSLMSTLLYVGLMALMMVYVLKKVQGAGFMTDMKDKKVTKDTQVKMDDVQGIDEVKEEVQEIIDYLKNPSDNPTGAKMPRGILLIGPPGNGKTLLAKAIASEAGVPFFAVNGSEFVEMFVGRGAGRARDLFNEAKKVAPCVIFIDEIDTVGQKRGTGSGYGHSEQEQTLNQLLSELDGFTKKEGIVVVAATNRQDVLDSALMSRFNKQIPVMRPQTNGQRVAILSVHLKNKPVSDTVNLEEIAGMTSGFSGRKLADLTEEAARLANRRIRNGLKNKQPLAPEDLKIQQRDFINAWQNVLIGPGKPMHLFAPEFLERVRGHEGLGHAWMCQLLNVPMHIISAQPRGETGGIVAFDESAFNPLIQTKQDKLTQLLITLGGMAAEDVLYGGDSQVSTGPTGDLQMATEQLQAMMTQHGMFPKEIGLMVNHPNPVTGASSFTPDLQKKVEDTTQSLLANAYARVRSVIAQTPEADRKRILETLKQTPVIAGKAQTAKFFESTVLEANRPALQKLLQEFLKQPLTPLPPGSEA